MPRRVTTFTAALSLSGISTAGFNPARWTCFLPWDSLTVSHQHLISHVLDFEQLRSHVEVAKILIYLNDFPLDAIIDKTHQLCGRKDGWLFKAFQGSIAYVHGKCLQRWTRTSFSTLAHFPYPKCELCLVMIALCLIWWLNNILVRWLKYVLRRSSISRCVIIVRQLIFFFGNRFVINLKAAKRHVSC